MNDFVIQSEAKDLGNKKVDVTEILRRYTPLNDKSEFLKGYALILYPTV